MFDLLLVLVFSAHLLAVNLAGAGPILCLWLDFRQSRRGDDEAGALAAELSRRSLHALVWGGVLGLALLGLLAWRYPHAYFDAWRSVAPSRWWFLIPEYFFSLAILAIYAAMWRPLRKSWLHRLLCVVGTTNLLYHFPTQFAIVGLLTQQPPLRDLPYDHLRLLANREVLAAVTHHLLAGLAVAGACLMVVSQRLGWPPENADRWVSIGARWALLPTMLQAVSGIVYLFELPERLRAELLGDGIGATLLFAAALAASLWLMHVLAGLSWGDTGRPQVRRALLLLPAVIVLMVAARHAMRRPYFEQQESAPAVNRSALRTLGPGIDT